jgi:hypothetical protein
MEIRIDNIRLQHLGHERIIRAINEQIPHKLDYYNTKSNNGLILYFDPNQTPMVSGADDGYSYIKIGEEIGTIMSYHREYEMVVTIILNPNSCYSNLIVEYEGDYIVKEYFDLNENNELFVYCKLEKVS